MTFSNIKKIFLCLIKYITRKHHGRGNRENMIFVTKRRERVSTKEKESGKREIEREDGRDKVEESVRSNNLFGSP
jgi:hypothetical protein